MTIKLKRAFSFTLAFMLLFSIMLTGEVMKPLNVSAAQLSASVSLKDSTITNLNTPVTVNLSLTGFPYTGTNADPNDVVLLIDRSGSMSNEYPEMIAAAKGFANKLDLSAHRIGIVLYSDNTDTLSLTNDKNRIYDYLDNALDRGASGSTAMDKGINEAVKMLKSKRSSAHGSIVLMTDGIPDNVSNAQTAAAAAKKEGNAFYTVALCPSAASAANIMLKTMATTESSHYSVFSTSKLNSVYSSIANNIGKVNAKNIKVVQEIGDRFTYVPGSADNSIPLPSYVSADRLEWDINELAPGVSNITYQVRLKSEFTEYELSCISGEVTYTDYNGAEKTITIRPSYAYNELHSDVKIDSITPDEGEKKKEHTVTIRGEGFFGATINYSGFTLTPASVNDEGTEMVVNFPSVSKSGVKTVTVKNDRKKTADIDFTVITPIVERRITVINSCTPNIVPLKETTTVTLEGENFTNPIVKVDGFIQTADKFTVSDDGKTMTLQVTINSKNNKDVGIFVKGNGCESGTIIIKAQKPAPLPKPVPSITAISPDKVMQNSGETDITVTGQNLNNLKTFSVAGTKLTAADCSVSADGTQLTFTLPEQTKAGNKAINIITDNGMATRNITVEKKTYLKPAVTGCNLTEYKRKTSTEVVLTGENFESVSSVSYNGFVMTNFTVSADGKTITFTPQTYHTPSAKATACISIVSKGGNTTYTLPIVK